MDLNFKELTIDDKELFLKFFHDHHPLISEYTFSNLYVWKKNRQIKYAIFEEGLIIQAIHKDKTYFMPPIGFKDLKSIYNKIFDWAKKNNQPALFNRVGEDHIAFINDCGFNITEDNDNSDYIYNTDDLAFLKGRKFSNKRGWIIKFTGEYYHKYLPYTDECKNYCIELAENWLNSRDEKDQKLIDEFDAIKIFLENYHHFKIPGGILCIDNKKIAAWTFGEKLNKDTFVVHFEKADQSFTGAYQAINKFFAENVISPHYKFTNREQDLGIAGLRKAKLSYNPVKMFKKYIVSV